MRTVSLCAVVMAFVACAGPGSHRSAEHGAALLTAAANAEAPCILVLPFVNFSDLKGAALAVSSRLTVELDAHAGHAAVDSQDISAVLGTYETEEEAVLTSTTGLEVGGLVGANAVLFGTLGGSWQRRGSHQSTLLLDARLLELPSRQILWADSRVVRPDQAQSEEDALVSVQLAASELARSVLTSMPSPRAAGSHGCFQALASARRHSMAPATETADVAAAPSSDSQPTATSAATAPSPPVQPAAPKEPEASREPEEPGGSERPTELSNPVSDTARRRSRGTRRKSGTRRRKRRKERGRSASGRHARKGDAPASARQARLASVYYYGGNQSAAPAPKAKADHSGETATTSATVGDDIQRVVDANRRDVRWCAEVAGLAGADVRGNLQIEVHTDGAGRVLDTEVISTTLQDEALAECFERRIRAWTFPSAAAKSQIFVLPFVI
jgi:hypothetical protein